MDFAKKELLKYGWTEGKGLGKNENGIVQAIKPKLKFDNTGVGHDASEQFTFNWWENVYNKAADNIQVTKTDSGELKFNLKSGESINVTTKKDAVIFRKGNNNMEYGSFLKTSKLTAEGNIDIEDKAIVEVSENKIKKLTDDELFAACGGRTAHKGARHGLKLNGKLARVEEQERKMLEMMLGVDKKKLVKKEVELKRKKLNKSKQQTEEPKISDDLCRSKKKKKSKHVL